MFFQKKGVLFSLFIILAVAHSALYAAQNSTKNTDTKPTTKRIDTNKKPATKSTKANKKPVTKNASGADVKFDPNKSIDFSVVMGPYYSPEASLAIAGAVVGLYHPDVKSQLSSLVIEGFGSINGSYLVNIHNDTFLNSDSRQLYLYLQVLAMDVVYYGKGYQENIQDHNLVEYHTNQYAFKPTWKERLYGNVFVGVGADATYSKTADFTEDFRSVVDIRPLQETSVSVAPTALINYDSRAHVLNAKKGLFLQYKVSWFDDTFGSNKNFTLQNVTYNQYLAVNKTDVLAWQLIGEFSNGDVAWDRMPSIGGIGGLRGYNSGRYQDEQMITAQVEYRLHIIRRHGMVFWLGVGTIADKVSEFKTDELLPNIGVGYRYRIKENVNMRFDVGYGKNGPNVYLSVNEAF